MPVGLKGKSMSGKREQTKKNNRTAILEAARDVFSRLGYGATTVRDIIRATDLASGTFYNYFKSKEEVFEAIQDETALRVRPRLREERKRARTIDEFVSGTFVTFFESVAEDRRAFAVIRRNADAIRIRMDTPEIIAGFDELRADLAQAIGDGLFPPVDVDFLVASFVGLGFEIAEYMLKRDPIDPQGAAAFATALFLGGYKALPHCVAATQDAA
ncbi:MAG: TetR/AcrR family transcriptional regulator [Alphaproteobacteria bacterium]|nr:TetR/AcrR family transcriptional regulator [Alphaproteobacteria bacterium]